MALSGPERALSLEAALWLGAAQIAIAVVPFRHLVRWLKKAPPGAGRTGTEFASRTCRRVGQTLDRIGRHWPREPRCLALALAGRMLLVRRGLNPILYLGLARPEPRGLAAHAWLECGGLIITGRNQAANHVPVANFGGEAD